MDERRLRVAVDIFALYRKEPHAMCALLLADEVVTAMPIPPEAACERIEHTDEFPHTKRFFEEIIWLLRDLRSVISCSADGDYTQYAVAWVHNFMTRHEVWGSFIKKCEDRNPEAFSTAESTMETLASGIVAGDKKPYPELVSNFILAIGLQSFALKHGIPVLQSPVPFETRRSLQQLGLPELPQHPELNIGTHIFRHLMPIITRADGETIHKAREVLKDTLHPLRLALSSIAGATRDVDDPDEVQAIVDGELLPYLADYRKAFKSRSRRFLDATKGVEKKVATGTVALAGVMLGVPPAAAAMAGLVTAGATVALSYGRQAAESRLLEREHMFGFLAGLERSTSKVRQ